MYNNGTKQATHNIASIDVKVEQDRSQKLEKDQRDYLNRRLRDISQDKEYTLRKKFNMDSRRRPKNPDELVEWIKNGDFTFTKEYLRFKKDRDEGLLDEYDDEWRNFFDAFEFTKAVKPDLEGYDKASDAKFKAYLAAQDAIHVLPLEEGLKALRKFQDTEF